MEATALAPQIPEVTRLELALGTARYLPEWDSLPEEFRRGHVKPWCDIVGRWFFNGLSVKAEGLVAKPEIDQQQAPAALSALLKSFDPDHNHKINGIAYLMSQWFDIEELG